MGGLLDSKRFHDPRVAQWLMRLGLAFVFAYAGMGALRDPQAWAGYLPHFLAVSAQASAFMRLFGAFELVLAAWLIWGRWLRLAAAVAFAMLAGIVVMNPNALIVTFRDVGLAALAAALFFSV